MKISKQKIVLILILALVLCAAIVLGILVSRNSKETPADTTPVHGPTTHGKLILACDATFQITYDGNGVVQDLEGLNDNGATVVSQYTDNSCYGIACSELVSDLIQKCYTDAHLDSEYPNIIIKLVHGSTVASPNFLEDIVKAAEQTNPSDAPVLLIKTEDLDETGYIAAETARILLQQTLGLNSPETVRVVGEMEDEQYTFVAIVGGRQNMYSVHAVTGQVVGIIVQEPDIFDGYYEERPDTNEDIIPDMYWEEYVEVPEEPVPEVTEGE